MTREIDKISKLTCDAIQELIDTNNSEDLEKFRAKWLACNGLFKLEMKSIASAEPELRSLLGSRLNYGRDYVATGYENRKRYIFSGASCNVPSSPSSPLR